MGKRAILFPGQGAQKVGMGRDLYDSVPAARNVYDRAGAALGFDLATLCFEGPEDELNDTAVCQPAVLVTSLAALEALKAKAPDAARADLTAGLSLGEYTALVYAGAIDLEDAVRLVRRRGLFMKEAGEQNPGSMVSVLGAAREDVERLIKACRDKGPLVAANFNSPGQVVLSGAHAAVDAAVEAARDYGAKRAVPLAVSGAFHSPLMQPAAEKLRAELDRTEVRPPAVPLVSNVTADYVRDPDEIRDLLARQLTHSVLWEDSMRRMIADGMTEALELGPGRVLCGLLARIDRNIATRNVGALDDLQSVPQDREDP